MPTSESAAANQPKIGVLISNLGSPDEPTAPAVGRYLKQFLSDPRVVKTNRLLWWFVLNVIILNIRPKPVAEAYPCLNDSDEDIDALVAIINQHLSNWINEQ